MKMGIKFCPKCHSENVEVIETFIASYMCKDCGYSGGVFPEKEILGSEANIIKKGEKKK